MNATKHITAEEVFDEVRLRMLQAEPESVKQYPDTKALRTQRAAMMLAIMGEEIAQRRNAQTDLLVACQAALEVMNMQLKRESEEFHIPAHTARHIWDETMAKLQSAITKAGGTP